MDELKFYLIIADTDLKFFVFIKKKYYLYALLPRYVSKLEVYHRPKVLNAQSSPDYASTQLARFITSACVWIAGVIDQQGTEESGRAERAEAAAATATTRGGRRGGWRRCRQSGGERLR